jgi:hypothetical protein
VEDRALTKRLHLTLFLATAFTSCHLFPWLQAYLEENLCDTRWLKYDRDKLWLVYTQIVPVIFEPPRNME